MSTPRVKDEEGARRCKSLMICDWRCCCMERESTRDERKKRREKKGWRFPPPSHHRSREKGEKRTEKKDNCWKSLQRQDTTEFHGRRRWCYIFFFTSISYVPFLLCFDFYFDLWSSVANGGLVRKKEGRVTENFQRW